MMIEYKYKKRKNKFIENGHTMFEFDVLQRLKRLAYLEEQLKQGQLFSIDSVRNRIDFKTLRESYFKECVDKADNKRTLYVCLAPHDLFEWFKKELLEY